MTESLPVLTIHFILTIFYAYAVSTLVHSFIRIIVKERVEVANGGEAYTTAPYILLGVSFIIKLILIAFVVSPFMYTFTPERVLVKLSDFLLILYGTAIFAFLEFVSLHLVTLIKTLIIIYLVRKTKNKTEVR